MPETFHKHPIVNSPYEYPSRHWELDADGQPTNRLIEARRRSDLITPVPEPKKRKAARPQAEMVFEDDEGLSSAAQAYDIEVSFAKLVPGFTAAGPAPATASAMTS